jgi:hypothetical protein
MLPASFLTIQELSSVAGGFAASIAVGAFIGQAFTTFGSGSDRKRRRDTAFGGFIGLGFIIGLFLFSGK